QGSTPFSVRWARTPGRGVGGASPASIAGRRVAPSLPSLQRLNPCRQLGDHDRQFSSDLGDDGQHDGADLGEFFLSRLVMPTMECVVKSSLDVVWVHEPNVVTFR